MLKHKNYTMRVQEMTI